MQQKPTRGHRQLRKGRRSIPGTYYYLTLGTLNKKLLLATPKIADIIFQSFDWLETNDRLRWFCIVVMPDHIHAVIQLGSKQILSRLIQSFKSHTAKQVVECVGNCFYSLYFFFCLVEGGSAYMLRRIFTIASVSTSRLSSFFIEPGCPSMASMSSDVFFSPVASSAKI